MRMAMEKVSPVRLQWIIWIFVLLINFISLLPMDGWLRSGVYTVFNGIFYAITIYSNIYWLLPRLYEKGYRILYVITSVIWVLAIGTIRTIVTMGLYNRFFAGDMPSPVSAKQFTYYITATFILFLLSFVVRFALDYFKLKQQADEIIAQKSRAELNLLKSKVQPHFLFNTLNNIYYEAYREAPRTALFIGQLAEIMRYFVDESPKDKVALATEIQFIENYIALERIRIRYPIQLSFEYNCSPGAQLPPMLLMTFVENIFKHGIDKASTDNKVEITLVQETGFLTFHTTNQLLEGTVTGSNGFGLQNLRDRLDMLYGRQYELQAYAQEHIFHAYLKIPLL